MCIFWLCKFRFNPIFVAEAEVWVIKNLFVKVYNCNSRYSSTTSIFYVNCNDLTCIHVLPSFYHFSQNLILLMSCLNCIKNNASVQYPKVRSEVFWKWVIPVFKFGIWPSGCHLPWSRLHFVHCVIKPVFGSKATIELTFEVSHESSISDGLGCIVAETSVLNCTIISIVGARRVSSWSKLIRSRSVEIH